MEHTGYSMRSLKSVLDHEGYKGLYRGKSKVRKGAWPPFQSSQIIELVFIGYSVSVFCIPLFHTIYFPLYEECKIYFSKKYGWR